MPFSLLPNYDITPFTTFGVPTYAEYAFPIASETDLHTLVSHAHDMPPEWFILGGGSNILFSRPIRGLTLLVDIRGIEHLHEDTREVVLRVGAGESWDPFVSYCVTNGYGGVENLSLIYGSVGATPIQNIGAYGTEVSEVIEYVETVDLQTGEDVTFSREDCRFGYRTSIFKSPAYRRYFITHVVYRLSKNPQVNTSYRSLQTALATKDISSPTIADVRRTVIELRQSKLPDPAQVGNAGSFFQNVHVSQAFFAELQKTFPDIPSFSITRDIIKVPAAWLIEYCGWKGYREGDAGVWPYQPLVMVNYGKAGGQDILDLSERVRTSVWNTFGLWLEREVTVY